MLLDLCNYNKMRINNTFFDHWRQYKITSENYKNQDSVADFIIINRKVNPRQLLELFKYRLLTEHLNPFTNVTQSHVRIKAQRFFTNHDWMKKYQKKQLT